MKSKPPLLSQNKIKEVEDFISGAEASNKIKIGKGKFPWEQPGVREDVKQNILFRLPEPLKLKIDYLSETQRKSRNQIILDSVLLFVEKELSNII